LGHYLQLNTAQVADRVIDGEAVIIHFGTNYYYSLNPAGTVLWEALRQPCRMSEFTAGETDGVTDFLARLREEELVIEVDPPPGVAADGAPSRLALAELHEAPRLTKYDTLDKLIVSGE